MNTAYPGRGTPHTSYLIPAIRGVRPEKMAAPRARELVKGRVLESALLTPREVGEQLCEECHAELVHVIGSKFVLFRRNLDEPKIALVRNNPKNAKAKTVKAVKPAQKVKAAKAAARKEQSAKRVYARPAGKRR